MLKSVSTETNTFTQLFRKGVQLCLLEETEKGAMYEVIFPKASGKSRVTVFI